MNDSNKSRRNFIKTAMGSLSIAMPIYSQKSVLLSYFNEKMTKKHKIVCVGGHPDDPESGCGGALAKLSNAGHDCTVIYLTRGEAGIMGKSHTEAATIRTKEAESACAILGCKAIFVGQIDGDTVVNNAWINTLQALIEKEKPDIVFTHWTVDTHPDHQAAGILSQQVYYRLNRVFSLYHFEVCVGEQTGLFHPTDYVDITETQEIKRKAINCHVSQNPEGIYGCGHTSIEDFRGREVNVKAAEAFILMPQADKSKRVLLKDLI
jgi:LmbE family N-acetylglucosaminyl deacetylase